MSTPKLPPESFVALAAVTWADGRMTASEKEGLRHAAKALGLEGDDLETVERATERKVSLDDFDESSLAPWDRLVTYGVACWLSRLDGVKQADEIESLRALASRFEDDEVTPFKLQHAASTAFDVSMAPEGRRPDKFDFEQFEKQLRARLPSVK